MEFTFDYNENEFFGFAPTSVATLESPTAPRHATPGQLAKYRELCDEKHVTPQSTEGWSYDRASAEISKLLAFHPMSDAQREMIFQKLEHLQSLDVTINIPASELDKLTGGRDGTASQLIQQLIDLERRYLDREKVSENQLRTLVSWYYCPDIPFEEYDIPLTVPTDIVYDGIPMKRRLDPIEFAEQIQQKMNFQSASEFINRYRADFHEWRKTRITMQQMSLIRQLESRMADISNPKVLELAVDLKGNVVELAQPAQDRGTTWSPNAYIPAGDA